MLHVKGKAGGVMFEIGKTAGFILCQAESAFREADKFRLLLNIINVLLQVVRELLCLKPVYSRGKSPVMILNL